VNVSNARVAVIQSDIAEAFIDGYQIELENINAYRKITTWSIKSEWIWNSGGLQQCFRCYSEEWGQSQVECM